MMFPCLGLARQNAKNASVRSSDPGGAFLDIAKSYGLLSGEAKI